MENNPNSNKLLVEFRRELLKGMKNIPSDSFLTKKEVESLINISYGSAKQRILEEGEQRDDEPFVEDEH